MQEKIPSIKDCQDSEDVFFNGRADSPEIVMKNSVSYTYQIDYLS